MDEESILDSQLDRAEQDSKIVKRVLSSCQWDYFTILDIEPERVVSNDLESLVTEVKKSFRKTSLRLHPDRNKHVEAPEAFARLKKAELVITSDNNEEERTRLIDIYKDVVNNNHEGLSDIRSRIALVLEELVHQQETDKLARQHQEASRLAEQTRHRKIQQNKRQSERQWEDDRDHRVANWRSFIGKVDKKKKKKTGKLKKLA
ncbi:uncharacterized protein KQ657_004749 [Scheffersomyces spartinae]|uniref:J domain-containing protein n=1 Tax=Scheffersomyces spartinae TaxID=45513 RepID=A0A9P8AJ65_9ASCO|nr:uncharacterized protein KQ657_004749 [Scheffersomyces spartinae]KAG7194534.1 hypothetical protein KQ657_004749 [Scheffersomyces spartinae]